MIIEVILKTEGTIIGILTFVIIFLITFGIIKLIFKPIKTSAFGETTYTDSKGNYVGQSVNNSYGQNTYTNANENITTSNTNYAGEETFDDGTTTSSDSFGNNYYH